jgi:Zn-dependent peptidase ImmA (M78 family)
MSKKIDKIEFPTTVDVEGMPYSVKVADSVVNSHSVLYGKVDYDTQEITISTQVSPVRQNQILLHECIHAMSHEIDLDLSETQVFGLTLGFKNFIKNNQEFITTLMHN